MLTEEDIVELNKKYEKIKNESILNDNLEGYLDLLVKIEKKIMDKQVGFLINKRAVYNKSNEFSTYKT